MFGYHTTTRVTLSCSLISRWLLVTTFLALLLMLPRQVFSTIYGLVTDQGNHITPGNVVIVDLDNKTVVETIPVGVNPEGIVLGGPGYAYVANSGSNSVSVIEIAFPESNIIKTITGIVFPLHLDIAPYGEFVFVTNKNGITVIDTNDNSLKWTVPPVSTDFEPHDIENCGSYMCVSYPDEFIVRVLDIDLTNNEYNIVWEMSTSPDRPMEIVTIPDYIYAITGSTVSKIGNDYCSPLPGNYFNNPEHLALHLQGNDLYVANKGDNTVSVITIETVYISPLGADFEDELLTRIDVGNSPSAIAFHPDGTYAYVVNSGGGTISIVDTSTKTVVDTISDITLINPVEIAVFEVPNTPPHVPSNPYPPGGEIDVPISPTLSWEGGDPDPGDTVTYDVFMGTDLTMGLEQVCTGIVHPETYCTPTTPLEYGTTYYWMVVATDSSGNTSEVPYPYWSFTTQESAPPYEVTITPRTVTVGFEETIQFSASTTFNGEIVSGDYIWDLTSSLGSIIDENGLYTAGTIEGIDSVTVIDTAHEDITDSALVTVTSSGPPCEVSIVPSSATVAPGETISFVATTNPVLPNTECNEGSYLWSVDSPIGSSITQDGMYTAGINNTGGERLDIITATDTANGNIVDAAEITVLTQGAYIVTIIPEDTTLASLNSLQFTAQTADAETGTPYPGEECSYRWEISPPSTIGSIINKGGLYVAGLNFTDNLVTETIRVFDTAHNDATAEATVTVLVKYISIPYLFLPPGPLITSYRMISSGPIWPVDGDALHSIPGYFNYNPFLIRLFRWDGGLEEGQGGYREYPDIPSLEPGIGIWALILSGGFLMVDGTPIDTSQPFTITIPPGWTQIGHPFPFAVNWNQVATSSEVEPPWTFIGSYLPAPILTPWHGYFVFNNSSSSVTISIPSQESVGETLHTPTPLSGEEEGWQLQIGAHNIPFFWLKDNYNYIGISEESCVGRDSKDLHEPPPVSPNQVLLYFLHEWKGKEERYTTDFRSSDSPQEVFELTVNPGNEIFSLMRLSWPDIAKVPHKYRLEFTDPETGITLDMREIHEYWFFSYLGIDKQFTIFMTNTLP